MINTACVNFPFLFGRLITALILTLTSENACLIPGLNTQAQAMILASASFQELFA